MTYFELINKCLVELNYREVLSWNALTLNDHKRLKDILSRLNSQICSSDEWPFLQRFTEVSIAKGNTTVSLPVDGVIDLVCVDGSEYTYSSDFKRFLLGNPVPGCFSIYAGTLYLPDFGRDVKCQILYNTNYSAVDSKSFEKKYLEAETDSSLIPEVFQEPLLVYGACMRLKANPEHAKFKYWYSMYNDTLATMRTKTKATSYDVSTISLQRD